MYIRPIDIRSPTNAIIEVATSDFRNKFFVFLYMNSGNQRNVSAFISVNHPMIGMIISHPPFNFQ